MGTRPQRRVSRTATIAPPTGGIDDMNAIASMDPRYAIEMSNWFPQATTLRVRPGYKQWTTGLPANAKTLVPFQALNVTGNKIFAATDSGFFDITATGVAGAAVRALTNGYVDYVTYANVAGQYLVVVNGSAESFLYDGTTYSPLVYNAAPASAGQMNISTLTTNNLVKVASHKRRLWFVERDSMRAWYLPTDAVSGNATQFLLGSIFKRGGYLMDIFTWTRGAGDGIDDILVFQSSNGELVGYAGTDPASTTTWSLEAVFYVGAPLADRTNADLGTDIAIINVTGVMGISAIVGGASTEGDIDNTLSKRISRTLNELCQNTSFAPGWELICMPGLQYLVILVPGTANRTAMQFVMNTLTGAWTTFDYPALTAVQYGNRMFFSDTTGKVFITGGGVALDNVLLNNTGGTPIVAGVMQAYIDFGDSATDKHYKVVRPIFSSSVRPSYIVRINADYGSVRLSQLQTPGPVSTQLLNTWDSAIWDAATWSDGIFSYAEWVGVTGVGYSAALLMKTRTSADTEFVACNWAFEPGSSL